MGIPEEHEFILVGEACAALRSAAKPGDKSQANRMERRDLFDIAYRVLIKSESGERVVTDYAGEMRRHRVSRKVLLRWITAVRAAYGDLRMKRVDDLIADQDTKRYAGNPEALLDDLIKNAGPQLVKGVKAFDTSNQSKRYTTTNFIRAINDTIDRLTKLVHKRAQTKKILADLAALGDDAKKGNRTAQEIGQMLEALVRGADPAQVAAALAENGGDA